jgi:hypothetical protein
MCQRSATFSHTDEFLSTVPVVRCVAPMQGACHRRGTLTTKQGFIQAPTGLREGGREGREGEAINIGP